jgi:hypothetical protein
MLSKMTTEQILVDKPSNNNKMKRKKIYASISVDESFFFCDSLVR